MAKKFLDIDHSRIDTLSDGIFAIALTLLGFDLIGSVKKASEAANLTDGLLSQWPIYFSFIMGFFVLYAIWYQYHVMSQYAGRPHAGMVWQHGFGLLFASLVPFGAALLGENLNTPNAAQAVFYFGVLIFADSPVQMVFFLSHRRRGDNPVSEDSPFTGEVYAKLGLFMSAVTTAYGIVAVFVALVSPWIAIGLYTLYLASKVNPVTSFNRLVPRLNGLLKLGLTD